MEEPHAPRHDLSQAIPTTFSAAAARAERRALPSINAHVPPVRVVLPLAGTDPRQVSPATMPASATALHPVPVTASTRQGRVRSYHQAWQILPLPCCIARCGND